MRYPACQFTSVSNTRCIKAIEGLLTRDHLNGKLMGNGISHAILFLMVISSIVISLPEVKGGCSGGCSISGSGGISSTSFMGDRAVDISMSSFDEFVRDNLGSNSVAALQAKSPSQGAQLNSNSSLGQTGNGNSSQNGSAVMNSSDSRIVKLGAIGMQDSRLSTLASAAFDNNWL